MQVQQDLRMGGRTTGAQYQFALPTTSKNSTNGRRVF